MEEFYISFKIYGKYATFNGLKWKTSSPRREVKHEEQKSVKSCCFNVNRFS